MSFVRVPVPCLIGLSENVRGDVLLDLLADVVDDLVGTCKEGDFKTPV